MDSTDDTGAKPTTQPCECCGEPATRQDADGVWLCEGDWRHLAEHAALDWLADCSVCGAIGPDYCERARCEDPRYVDDTEREANAAFNDEPTKYRRAGGLENGSEIPGRAASPDGTNVAPSWPARRVGAPPRPCG